MLGKISPIKLGCVTEDLKMTIYFTVTIDLDAEISFLGKYRPKG